MFSVESRSQIYKMNMPMPTNYRFLIFTTLQEGQGGTAASTRTTKEITTACLPHDHHHG